MAEGDTTQRDEHDCMDGTPDEDHDWYYDGGDPDVGLYGCYVCRDCGKVDSDREPPSDDDYDY